MSLRAGDIKTARGNVGESQRVGPNDETTQPRTRTATSIKNANRAGAGSTQVSQFRLEESPDLSVGIGVQTIKGIKAGRIAIGLSGIIATSLIG